MRSIYTSIRNKYRGITSDGIIYRVLAKYRGIYRPAVLTVNQFSSWHSLLHLFLTNFSHCTLLRVICVCGSINRLCLG